MAGGAWTTKRHRGTGICRYQVADYDVRFVIKRLWVPVYLHLYCLLLAFTFSLQMFGLSLLWLHLVLPV